jgi:DNA-binding NarL/FixJ family response regulator
VLIVDDGPACRSTMRDLLQRRGFDIVGEAGSAAEAIASVERLSPDAVLLDVGLPDRNGFDLAAALIRDRPVLAVLITSADCDESFDAHARAVGARGFVAKADLSQTDLEGLWLGTASDGPGIGSTPGDP